jgi:formimidoylglutamate deiminase
MPDAILNQTAGALFAPQARLPSGWRNNVLLEWNSAGTLTRVSADTAESQLSGIVRLSRTRGPVLAGMPNLHSHSFQGAMAGLTEYRAQAADSFWSWRDLMYRFAARITPESAAAIAHYLYVDMLKAGYTSVCEFHYVHHQPDGTPYANPAEMAERVVDAAEQAGLGMTMLPVLYQYSHFGAQPPTAGQQRFIHTPDQFLKMLGTLRQARPETPSRRYGAAPHSLRAVSPDSLNALLAGMDRDFPGAPIHIHVAEQTAEVDACLAIEGARPLQWLLDHFPLDPRWCLIHATHIDADETQRLAASGATAGLCPTTEANLGDGIFPAAEYLAAGGRFGIGSDSHACVDWRSELRMLEYGQRLQRRQRNVLAGEGQAFVADRLFDAAALGGKAASGRACGILSVGHQADFMVLDPEHATVAGQRSEMWLSGIVFSERSQTPVLDVYAAGKQWVRDRRHIDEERVYARYRQALSHLLQ